MIQIVERLAKATVFSWAGLRAAVRDEEAFRLELIATIVVAPLALCLGQNGAERALLLGSWLLVMVVELINSAIETAVNRVGREEHELSGRAKDLGSAAVFGAILLTIIVWVVVLARS